MLQLTGRVRAAAHDVANSDITQSRTRRFLAIDG